MVSLGLRAKAVRSVVLRSGYPYSTLDGKTGKECVVFYFSRFDKIHTDLLEVLFPPTLFRKLGDRCQ